MVLTPATYMAIQPSRHTFHTTPPHDKKWDKHKGRTGENLKTIRTPSQKYINLLHPWLMLPPKKLLLVGVVAETTATDEEVDIVALVLLRPR